jgi:hypothetical protein
MIFKHLSRFLGSIQKTVILIINLKSLDFLHRRSSKEYINNVFSMFSLYKPNPFRYNPQGLSSHKPAPVYHSAPPRGCAPAMFWMLWMVDFMENPQQKMDDEIGYPHVWKSP